jgi:HlyD family secretion protein
MKECILEFKDLTDSREMLDAKAPNFMVWSIYVILSILFGALLWMWFSKMDIVVKAQGIVRPNTVVSSIVNVNDGIIKNLNFYEGKKVKKGDVLYKIDSKAIESQANFLSTIIPKMSKDLDMLYRLEKSIKTNTNLFKEDEIEYYNRYLTYKFKTEQSNVNTNRLNKKYEYEKSMELSFTTQSKLKDLETEYKYSELAMQKDRTETLANLKTEISNKENEFLKLKDQFNEVKSRLNMSKIVSPIDGVIQVVKNCNVGDYLGSGVEILRVIPNNALLNMEILVNNKDIGFLKVGQEVKYRLWALSYKEYGMIKGKITKISSDSSIDQKSGNSLYYRVEGTIPVIKLVNRSGNLGFVKIGMICDARIVQKRKRIFYLLLEKLDFMENLK